MVCVMPTPRAARHHGLLRDRHAESRLERQIGSVAKTRAADVCRWRNQPIST
jgi:hypothetical protein